MLAAFYLCNTSMTNLEWTIHRSAEGENIRVGKWYLGNCRSRKLVIQSQNLGTTFVMSLKVSFL